MSVNRSRKVLIPLIILLAAAWMPIAAAPADPNQALDLGGTNAYVTFGDPDVLGLATFTIETWFKREGTGATASSGSGGFDGIPLVTKGRVEIDSSIEDMNYFFGICDSAGGVLCADFEEGEGGSSPGLNHPVYGTIAIQSGTWYHAAATYDGTTWRLYLNGELDGESRVGQPPRSDSIQHAALATAIDSNQVPAGHFDGILDEVRIWDYGRTEAEIQETMNAQIASSPTGLVARWALDEGVGTVVHSTPLPSVDGDITNSGWSWVPGAPFDINVAPDTLSSPFPEDSTSRVGPGPEMAVYVSDPDGDPLTVNFYGREATTGSAENFTVVVLPDTQYYTVNPNGEAIFASQTQWISDTQATRNIVFVSHVGDLVQDGDKDGDDSEWTIADRALGILERIPAFTDGVPYGVTPGNRDLVGGVSKNEQWFGVSRFSGRSYYGGHYGADNRNNFVTFSASGMHFIVLNLDCSTISVRPAKEVLDWADALLKADTARRGIVVCHHILSGRKFSLPGQAIYDALKDNPNLFLMLGGHADKARRQSDTYNGNTVHSLRADYQSQPNGGSGWLRILEFQPASGQIQVTTYSPYLDQPWDPGDTDHTFTLSYDMSGDFTLIGTNEAVPSGSTTTMTWPNLEPGTEYRWYVTASDGSKLTTGPTWSFTTALSTTYDLALSPGWNLVSWPLVPATTDLAETLASCSACDKARAHDSRNGAASWNRWPGDLTRVDETMGLRLHATEPTTLTLTGWPPVSPAIELRAGWNLVGYPSQTVRPVAEALASIDGKYTQVMAFDATDPADPWKRYAVGLPADVNDLTTMGPGRGYGVYVTEECTWKVEP